MRKLDLALPSAHPLRWWRLAQKLSVDDLAALPETSAASISRIERGRQHPRPAMMRRLIEIANGGLTATNFYEWPG